MPVDPYSLIADDWHEPIIEDWKEKLDKLGFKEAKIMFSGFGSQGDGACFEARVTKEWAKLVPKNVMEEMAVDVVTLKLNGEDPGRWIWWWPPDDWDFSFRLKHSGHYCHENSVDVEALDAHFPERLTALWKWLDDMRINIREEARKLSREIYSELEDAYFKEYEWAEEEAKRLDKEREEEEEDESCSPTEAVTADAAATLHPE